MAVSKRLRHEVFRRDNHTCLYCGHSAPDVKITIDHATESQVVRYALVLLLKLLPNELRKDSGGRPGVAP
jgi:hypothetical protein